MSKPRNYKLTPEKSALIPAYWDKWQKIAFSTKRIDQNKNRELVKILYSLVDYDLPEIIFCPSPYAAINEMLIMNTSNYSLLDIFVEDLINMIRQELKYFWKQISLEAILSDSDKKFINYLENPDVPSELNCPREDDFNILDTILKHNQAELVWQLWLKKVYWKAISSFDWMYTAATFDFFISELDCYHNPEVSSVVEQLVLESGTVFPFEQYCFICDRPTKLFLDTEHRLHAENKPAIQFTDGFSIYSSHGVNNGFQMIQSAD
ncbi:MULTISPECIES: DUF6745 domain-containing protein [Nostocaceae]|uniref:DUF6745 domain-containing protein n=1 Tax=Nostocaceae TaxID=1162 RepID=UPI0016864F20|nr:MULTISPECIES: hypothetical protein [Nostocaceae]MBD2474517.1 hypothetical protein [Anabaena sp. FACHB-83]